MSHQKIGGLIRAATGDMAEAGRRSHESRMARFLAQVPDGLPDREARAYLLYRAHMSAVRKARK